MSARSSLRECARVALVPLASLPLAWLALAGCGAKEPKGDPAKFAALAKTMARNVPTPGAPECTGPQVLGGATMTMRTLLGIAKEKYEDRPEMEEFVNPPELDVPAARVLLDEKASTAAKRRAAAELALAPFYLVYLVDVVDVPMALKIKELKPGNAGGRALRYNKQSQLECARVFLWSNDRAVSADAIAKSDKVQIDPAVAQRLRDDLKSQLLKRIAALGAPPPVGTEMAGKPLNN